LQGDPDGVASGELADSVRADRRPASHPEPSGDEELAAVAGEIHIARALLRGPDPVRRQPVSLGGRLRRH
jgi:hypothetical protein